ncbi:tautomerase family protein [Sphingomonas sp. KR1UV-12]|uniref:Tautomerase family protein n=1 Tax=Sphingomonas aurea TaxID=3063994 RepID=A0ABT9EJB5_9SPHN|nr:tautomerase family protein [Sphingomonas sp. KR1UV-12]MDP1027057.1 tautomerase family protein [Sphingomonas sp. KR1UV-12]
MPHVVVKLWPGKSDDQKRRLTDAIVRGVTDTLGYGEDAVSIGLEEVPPADWTARVYQPDILAKWPSLTKQPGYGERPPARKDAR